MKIEDHKERFLGTCIGALENTLFDDPSILRSIECGKRIDTLLCLDTCYLAFVHSQQDQFLFGTFDHRRSGMFGIELECVEILQFGFVDLRCIDREQRIPLFDPAVAFLDKEFFDIAGKERCDDALSGFIRDDVAVVGHFACSLLCGYFDGSDIKELLDSHRFCVVATAIFMH